MRVFTIKSLSDKNSRILFIVYVLFVLFFVLFFFFLQMCAREDVDYQGQEITSRLVEMESKLECFDKKINVVRECCEKNLSMMETLLKKISAEEKKP